VITVAGLTPSLDLTYTVDSLRPGRIHRVPEVVRCAGGKALNMARAASTVGADVTVVAILGGPTGRSLQEMLASEGLAFTAVHSPAETRICVSIAAEDTGRLTEVYQEAAPLPAEVAESFMSTIAAALPTGAGGAVPGWLSVSGRAPLGSAEMIADLVRVGKRAGVRVAVDTHAEALPRAIEARPTLIKINREEAAELLAAPPESDLLEMALDIRARCGAVVVLTDGTNGSLAVDDHAGIRAEAPSVIGGYPVGSGDSFLGGLVAALDQGAALGEALRTATACGVANALVPGQGHFSYRSFSDLAAAVQLRTLT
jgi:1-phosphofructokinase family hexose kinase